MPFVVESEDKKSYRITLYDTSIDSIDKFWDLLEGIDESVFNYGGGDTRQEFYRMILSPSSILLRIDDIGVVLVHEMIPFYSATFSFFFFDHVSVGRQKVVLSVMKWLFSQFELKRIEIRAHQFSYYALHRIYKIGAFYEGTKRKMFRYKEKMVDVHTFSVLSEEITDEALILGYIPRNNNQKRWYNRITKKRRRRNG